MLDDADKRLLALLQAEGRLTNADLAARIGLSQSACHRRVRRLEETGVIAGYGARLDRRMLGHTVMAMVMVQLAPASGDARAAFEQAVGKMDDVLACHAVAGGCDFILTIVAADMDSYGRGALKGLAQIPGVSILASHFVLDTLKDAPGWPVV